ncbi:pentapeptide repeat-containing protein, partial [Ferrovibrio sp.]
MNSEQSYQPCPADLGERLESHSRFTLSIGTSVRVGRQLKLANVDLGSAKLTGRNLRRIVLKQCKLFCTDMRDVDAVEGEFNGSDLTAADLSGGNFSQTKMRGINLSRAVLNNTRFDGADFSPFHPTTPEGAELSGQNSQFGSVVGKGAS